MKGSIIWRDVVDVGMDQPHLNPKSLSGGGEVADPRCVVGNQIGKGRIEPKLNTAKYGEDTTTPKAVVAPSPLNPKPKFDRLAYQREYMRKRRAAKKISTSPAGNPGQVGWMGLRQGEEP